MSLWKSKKGVVVYGAMFLVIIVVGLILSLKHGPVTDTQPKVTVSEYVSPEGNDQATGAGPSTAFKTIQHALDVAKPGTVIVLAPGSYHEMLTTKVNGTKSQPITIKGPDDANDPNSQHKTVLYGTGRIVNINHNYYHLEGFAIDGQERLASSPYPTDPSLMNAYKDAHQSQIKDGRLIYIGSADSAKDVTGTSISNMFLQGAGGECVRLRNDTTQTIITDSRIQYCGLFAKKDGDDRYVYHNGEGVYIGTSPKSDNQPAADNDTSNHNTVSDNVINTFGSECVDIKENAHDNFVENNQCGYNLEPLIYDGSNLEVRGDHNTIAGNTIHTSAGWNIKLVSDSSKYDKGGNQIENNRLSGAAGNTNVYVKQELSKITFCGNILDGKTSGVSVAIVTKACAKP